MTDHDREVGRGGSGRSGGGGGGDAASEESFLARITEPLRASERLDATFESRLMTAVRAAMPLPPTRRGWWRQAYMVRVTPLDGLAVAAGIAALVVLGSVLTRIEAPPAMSPDLPALHRAPAVAAAELAHDTVYVVRFVFVAPDAKRVTLVGDFNNWDRTTTRLTPAGTTGVWTATVPLSAGRYQYAFIVDGTRWTADPTASITVKDDFGATTSLVTVGGSGAG